MLTREAADIFLKLPHDDDTNGNYIPAEKNKIDIVTGTPPAIPNMVLTSEKTTRHYNDWPTTQGVSPTFTVHAINLITAQPAV